MARKSAFQNRPSIAKCKRIVRPLISKIHGLTDLFVKFPSKFDFDVDAFTGAKVDGGNLRFTHPASASDRLVSLKPFISTELYQAYVEIFLIFRNIVATVCDLESHPGKVPRLTTLASSTLGKSVALGTKSTFYKLNQTLLFEQDTLPQHLQKYVTELSDEIDDWLQLDPQQVTETYRNEILLGYVLHVLVLNLRTLLYMLIPVLVHWLREQDCQRLSHVLRNLFMAFWLFLPHHSDYSHTYGLSHELTDPESDPSLPVFWLLHRVGFWKQMVRELGVLSLFGTLNNFDRYDALLLDSLARTNWLVLSHVQALDVYELLLRNVQNPNNTSIVVSVVSQQILRLQLSLKNAATSHRAYTVLSGGVLDLKELLQAWLAFSSDCLFNSLDLGNTEIFSAVFLLLQFAFTKCTHIIRYLEKHWTSTRLENVREMLYRFKSLCYQLETMTATCRILSCYYLDVGTMDIDKRKISSVAEFFANLMLERSENSEMANFLLWVYGAGTLELRRLARSCFEELYEEDVWQESRDLEHVHYILYE